VPHLPTIAKQAMGRKPSDPNRLYCSDEDARDIRSSSTSGKSVKIPCVDGKSDIVINNTMMKQKVHGLFKKCLEVQSDSGVKIPLVVANPLDGRVIYSSNLNSKESVNQNHDDHPAANKASSKLTRHRNASHSLKKWDNLNRSLCSIEKRIHDFDESRRVSKADLKKRPNCQMRSTVPPQVPVLRSCCHHPGRSSRNHIKNTFKTKCFLMLRVHNSSVLCPRKGTVTMRRSRSLAKRNVTNAARRRRSFARTRKQGTKSGRRGTMRRSLAPRRLRKNANGNPWNPPNANESHLQKKTRTVFAIPMRSLTKANITNAARKRRNFARK